MKILSEANAVQEIKENPDKWNVISIRDSNRKYSPIDEIQNLCKEILKLDFDDVFSDKYQNSYQKLATLEDIEKIIRFSEGKDNLLVHCFAGVSRSSAVAYIIRCTKENPWDAIQKLSMEDHLPNDYIVRLGAKLLQNKDILNAFTSKYGTLGEIL